MDRDIYGWSALCLQCGFMVDLVGPKVAGRALETCREKELFRKRLFVRTGAAG